MIISWNHTLSVSISLLSISMTSPCALAQDDMRDANAGSRLSFSAGIEVVSQYYFRGIVQEADGLITQPWGELGVTLYEFEGGSFGVSAGIWNSFHGDTDTSGTTDDTTEHWYESDLYVGVNLDYNKLSFGLSHIFYTSPSGAFGTVSETDFSISYDDSGVWESFGEGFAFSPSITLAFESGDNAADGGDTGSYLEFGIEPSFSLESSGFESLALSIPATVGLSIGDYYEDSTGSDETFGFFQVGAVLSMDLPIPVEYGGWSISGGVHVLMLGDAAKEINRGDSTEVIASIGISFEH